MKRRGIAVALFCALVAASVIWVYRPYPEMDLQQVHPRLRGLQRPFRHVRFHSHLDGGSLAFDILDARGTNLLVAVPATDYGAVYLDTEYVSAKSPGIRVERPEQSILFLQSLLEKDVPYDPLHEAILANWRGNRLRDTLPMSCKMLTGYYRRRERKASEKVQQQEAGKMTEHGG